MLKVTEDSDAVLMLAGLIPDYVSLNDIEGKIECEHFFPPGYRNTIEDAENGEKEEDTKHQDGRWKMKDGRWEVGMKAKAETA